jgi:hypothetical protein
VTGLTGGRRAIMIAVGILGGGAVLCGLCGSALFALNLLGFAVG